MKIRHFINGLATIALFGATPARAEWVEARTEHLVIDIDADQAVARDYAVKLERFDAALRRLYGVADDPTRRANPLHVYALKEGQYDRICECSDFAVGFYDPTAAGSTIFSLYKAKADERGKQGDLTPQVILLHEYGHHFMYTSYPIAYPLWYSEGFAEFNANAAFEANGAVDIGFPANYRAWSIRNEYEELTVREFFEPPDYFPVDTLYGRGWLMTHYLTLDPKRKGQLAVYLAEFNKGKSSLEAAAIAFGDIKKLYSELFDYRWRKTGLAKPLRVPAPKSPEVTVVQLSPGAAAMMPYHLLVAHKLEPKRARDLVKDASRVAAAWPNDVRVQADLAAISFIADDLDTADAAADRALAAEPGNRDALLQKGQIAVRRAGQSTAATPADWVAARAWYLKANKAEPNASLPLLLYYQSFVAAKQTPSKGAVLGLKRAAVLTPEDSQIRLLLARRLIGERDAKGARYLLQPVAFSPHAREDDNAARKVIGLIDAGDLPDAGKAMDDAIAADAKKRK